jgi:hypothetical protein
VTVTGNGNKGFEVSPQDMDGNLIGTLAAGDGSKLVGSGKYVTHTAASTAATKIWTFGWTAPATGIGDVTFYGAFVVSKPVTKLCTLIIPQNTTASPAVTAEPEIAVFPNPAAECFRVRYFNPKDEHLRMDLVNLAGLNLAVLVDEIAEAGSYSTTVNTPGNIQNGTYLLTITLGDRTTVRKIVIDR